MNINFTLAMQAIAFAAFIWFTARFVWPPPMRAVDTRQKAMPTASQPARKAARASPTRRSGSPT